MRITVLASVIVILQRILFKKKNKKKHHIKIPLSSLAENYAG